MEPDSEALWREGTAPFALLEDLYPKRTPGSEQPQERKCRLYLCACARRQWHRLPGVCRGLVELAEHLAESPKEREPLRAALVPLAEQLTHSDGSEDELATAGAAFGRIKHAVLGSEHTRFVACYGGDRELDPSVSDDEWRGLSALVYLPFALKTPPFGWVPRRLHPAALLREVYYNPNLFVPFPGEWITDNVRAIAQQVYDAREFSGMPVLGNALEEAGCDSRDILRHCRNTPAGAHVRGCWVLDRILRRG